MARGRWWSGTRASSSRSSRARPKPGSAAGKLAFVLHGRKLKGGFALARFARGRTGREWLLIKKKDERADPAWTLQTELTPRRRKALAVRIPPCEAS